MRGVVQGTPGDPSTLVVSDALPIPEPTGRELLIRVQVAAVNRLDLIQAKTAKPILPTGASSTLGVEISGTVAAMGTDCVLDFKLGEQVMALSLGGGYAEFCLVDERTVIKCHQGLKMAVAAAIPEAFMTAYQLLFFVGQMRAGETVLMHAASSTVGQAAIQMAVRKGITVYATCRSAEKCQKCLELGATSAFVIDTDKKFADQVLQATGGVAVNVVLDPVGSEYASENLRVLGTDGRWVLYGLMGGGAITDSSFLNTLMAKRISVMATTLRARPVEYKEQLVQALVQDPVAGLAAIAAGDMSVLVDASFPLEQVCEAHQFMAANRNIGKIVLTVASSASAVHAFEKELRELEERNK